jgi:hypothetical protein
MADDRYVAAITTATEAVRSAGLSSQEEPGLSAFRVVLQEILRLDHIPDRLGQPVPVTAPQTATESNDATPSTLVASWLGSEEEAVQDYFHFGDQSVELQIPSSQLPARKADRQRRLALLKLALERKGYEKSDVPGREINELCERYACLDQNLPKHLQDFENYISRRGKRGSYFYRLTQPGLEAARTELTNLLNAG